MGFGRQRKLETEPELYEYAVGALGRRMRSIAELKRLLRNRVEADTEIGKTLVELVVRRLKEELQLLQQPASYVGEVIKTMGKKKVLVKINPEGKYGNNFCSKKQADGSG